MTKPGKITVDWGHLALLAVFAGLILAYLFDARATSMRVNNLLLVQPVSILAIGLLLLVLPQCFRREKPEDEGEPDTAAAQKPKETRLDLAKILATMVTFVVLAFSMEAIGFDVAVFTFLVIGIFLCGERNWIANIAFSTIFTTLLVYGYGAIIPFPFPLAVL